MREYEELRVRLVREGFIRTDNEYNALDLVRWLKSHLINFNCQYYRGTFTISLIRKEH